MDIGWGCCPLIAWLGLEDLLRHLTHVICRLLEVVREGPPWDVCVAGVAPEQVIQERMGQDWQDFIA